MDTFCTLVIPIIINIALIATTVGIWQCINTVEVTLEETLQTGDNLKNITRFCSPQNLFLKDESETSTSVWLPKNTGELFDHGRPVLERSYKATKIVVYITICYGFFGIFILIAPKFICTINSNKKESLESIWRTIRLIELGICGAVLIGTSALLIASTIKITTEFTASPELCSQKDDIFKRIITKCCGNCDGYDQPKTFGHSMQPSEWELCTDKFLNCLEDKRFYFIEYCKDISVFVVGMMSLMFSNACFFLMVWVTVWCRNEWNYAEDDENVYEKPKTVRISNQQPVQYSEVAQEHAFNNENKDETENRVTFAQPNGGTPVISKGPGYQRPHDEYDLQSNDYFYDDQISNIRAMENSLTEAESLQRNRKKTFSVNEPQDLMSGSFTR